MLVLDLYAERELYDTDITKSDTMEKAQLTLNNKLAEHIREMLVKPQIHSIFSHQHFPNNR